MGRLWPWPSWDGTEGSVSSFVFSGAWFWGERASAHQHNWRRPGSKHMCMAGWGAALGTGWKTQQHGSAPQKGGGRRPYCVLLGVPGHS